MFYIGFLSLYLFTSELGSKEDYAREFKDTPFGLLVRKVAKLDHEAAMQAFSKFINDESLNAKQIAFVQKVIHYIEQNGYVESKAVLMKPPFDQPILFTRLFDGKMGGELMETISLVRKKYGVTILLIEHDMKLVQGICEYLYVLNFGKLLAEGTPAQVLNDPAVIKAYLGD